MFFKKYRRQKLWKTLSESQRKSINNYKIAYEAREKAHQKNLGTLDATLELYNHGYNYDAAVLGNKYTIEMSATVTAWQDALNKCRSLGIKDRQIKLLVGSKWM